MNNKTKLLILIFITIVALLVFLNKQESNENILKKNKLKGDIVFAYGEDTLNILNLPNMEISEIKQKDYRLLFPSYPSWSPDGQRIAFSQYRKNTGVVTILNLSDKNITELNNINLDCDFVNWSPSGEFIAFLGRSVSYDNSSYGLYVLSVKDMRYEAVTDILVGPYRPSWSPDSSRIAISTADKQILVIDINSKKQNKIIPLGIAPSWSPDGKYLAYRAKYSVYLYNFEDKESKKMISNIGFSDIRDFTWSPDSQYILFKELTDSKSPLEVISRDGRSRMSLKELGNIRGYSWKY